MLNVTETVNISTIRNCQKIKELEDIKNKSIIEKIQWITGITNISAAQKSLNNKIANKKSSIYQLELSIKIGFVVSFILGISYLPDVQKSIIAFFVILLVSLFLFIPLRNIKMELSHLEINGIYGENSRTDSDNNWFAQFRPYINKGETIGVYTSDIMFDEMLFDQTVSELISKYTSRYDDLSIESIK